MPAIVPGQRWISTAEPELGIGQVTDVRSRDLTILFSQVMETRIYRIDNAPLSRFRLAPGDRAQTAAGEFTVTACVEKNDLLFYTCESGEICESELLGGAAATEKSLFEKLFAGDFDSVESFDLRSAANELRHKIESSPVRGLVGSRIDLISHQLSIAARACAEGRLPRRLLSDEVGLGKTIEAGLIYHRLKRTNRIRRTLIIAPESLRLQWFAEMHRRFHSTFTIIDDEYCTSLDLSSEEDDRFRAKETKCPPNPFLTQDDLIVGMDWIFATHEQDLQEGLRGQQKLEQSITQRINWLLEAQFDLVIVDEAHTIDPDKEFYSRNYGTLDLGNLLSGTSATSSPLDARLNPEFAKSSAEYKLLSRIAWKTPGLLLLTATPVQLYLKAHFARLHLLDPTRYPDYENWLAERERYQELAEQLGALIDRIDSTETPWTTFRDTLRKKSSLRKFADSVPDDESLTTGEAIRFLSDTIGTGRVMIRNTRKSVGGFPERRLHAYPLKLDQSYRSDLSQIIDEEYDGQTDSFRLNQALSLDQDLFMESEQPTLFALWKRDEKALWLFDLLRTELRGKKVLVLCSTRPTAVALCRTIAEQTGIECELFHELMEMMERDQAAARFADDAGAQVLVASEIGSEGRNFQFAHDMVLFDLPIEPGLLEQRIGRLDRIGQKGNVEIHVPYVEGTSQHRLFQWYNTALDAFLHPLMGIEVIHNRFEQELRQQIESPNSNPERFETAFTEEVQRAAEQLREESEGGRDRLLEFNSFDPRHAATIVEQMQFEDEENAAEALVLEALEHFGVEVDHGHIPLTWVATPGDDFPKFDYPGLPAEGITATSDRSTALLQESVDLFTIDHPLVSGTLDLLLGGDVGRRAFALCRNGLPKGLFFEFRMAMECASNPAWNIQEVLHPIAFSVVLDRTGKRRLDVEEELSSVLLENGAAAQLAPLAKDLLPLMPQLQQRATELVREQADREVEAMTGRALRLIDVEIRRLRSLESGGYPGISKQIARREKQKESITEMLRLPALRLDALRLIGSR